MVTPLTARPRAAARLPHKDRSPWRDVPMERWQDWRWQMQHRITSASQLAEVIELDDDERGAIAAAGRSFRFAIPPYYASLMDPSDRDCPIRRQAVPTAAETDEHAWEIEDPLNEEGDSVAPGMTHRYPDRVLWVVIHECALFCRHCTRKRKVGNEVLPLADHVVDQGIAYLQAHPEVRDVLISGGDPLLLSDEKIDRLLGRLRAEVPTVEVIRFGSRLPVTLPQRITPELVEILRRHHPIWLNTHFNVPRELTAESERALALLADAGIPLGNQSVLLAGVNDCPALMKRLVQRLVANRVRPYYIYQCDLAQGLAHFRTTVAKGIEIMESLRGHTSGLAVPTFVVDAPSGGGKIPVMPTYLVSHHEHKVILRNFEGRIVAYEEPRDYAGMCTEGSPCRYCREAARSGPGAVGVAGLFDDDPEHIALVPTEVAEGTSDHDIAAAVAEGA